MTAAIDVKNLAGDVIVLYEKDNSVHDIARAARSLEQSSLHSQVLLVFTVVLGKQDRARRNTGPLYFYPAISW